MRLLLDTHIWVWSLSAPNLLGRRLHREIESGRNELWLSPLSVWEFLILCRKGRLNPEGGPRDWLAQAIARAPIKDAALTFEVAVECELFRLPHGDPVDHLLVACARVLDLTLVTADRKLLEAKQCRVMGNR